MQPYHHNHDHSIFRSIQLPSKKVLLPLAKHSPEKDKQAAQVRLRSSTSCQSYKDGLVPTYRRKYSLNKSVSIHYKVDQPKDFVPLQAKEFNEMVKKKHELLKIKHRIISENDCIPNILEIRESVRKSQVNFMRRMDAKLNADGHANLIANLRRDLHIQSHNYLKEMTAKVKKNRRYLRREDSHNDEEYVTINYRFPLKESIAAQ